MRDKTTRLIYLKEKTHMTFTLLPGSIPGTLDQTSMRFIRIKRIVGLNNGYNAQDNG